MMLTHDGMHVCPAHGGDVRAGSRVVLFVRNVTSKRLTVSTAAAQERLTNSVFGSPFLEPVAPINSAILQLRWSDACYHFSSALLSRQYQFTRLRMRFHS